MSLKGKTAVITGSNSGIGLGIAHEMAKAGASVVINSFTDSAEDHALAAEIAKTHGGSMCATSRQICPKGGGMP